MTRPVVSGQFSRAQRDQESSDSVVTHNDALRLSDFLFSHLGYLSHIAKISCVAPLWVDEVAFNKIVSLPISRVADRSAKWAFGQHFYAIIILGLLSSLTDILKETFSNKRQCFICPRKKTFR
jgi:hypothetical protein